MRTQQDQLLNRGIELWKPVVAAVNGYCLGGGMTLLLATDLRVCCESAVFGLSEVQRGVFPANGGTQRIIQQLPHAIAMEMLLIGDRFDAATAARWGLVNQVVPADGLMDAAMAYARRLAANAPAGRAGRQRQLALRSRDLDLAAGLRMEQVFLRRCRPRKTCRKERKPSRNGASRISADAERTATPTIDGSSHAFEIFTVRARRQRRKQAKAAGAAPTP
ncbi:enoyl-CoA hydratase/isomerase family protein [Achromobacter sp. DMS1]|uniref:enoyl-CoA hydratase/isomerase family protein n=1 Tax=Achromobacter sp. DMS1 TaxID=1688405 RepID=UPI000A6A47C3|nr:enoyl-CoA hydratase-related protein [Achromobacter sp. DMS1]